MEGEHLENNADVKKTLQSQKIGQRKFSHCTNFGRRGQAWGLENNQTERRSISVLTSNITTGAFVPPQILGTLEDVLEVVTSKCMINPVAATTDIQSETHVCMRVFTFSKGVCKEGHRNQYQSQEYLGSDWTKPDPGRMRLTHHCQSRADSRDRRSYRGLVVLQELVASRFIHDPGVAGWHDGGCGVGRWREGRSMFSSFTNRHALKVSIGRAMTAI